MLWFSAKGYWIENDHINLASNRQYYIYFYNITSGDKAGEEFSVYSSPK